ncbi:hypothetical protein RY831_23365 [Noviherbaspirillum sp. CPCC 100848]|uniref:Uncharacterized protein n=1 Tax=Noviherbaspirillum album TaxID=3080276 RepID=A0ABU6JFZ1_9BURK|nr:hypothetical protein [Noviherbaspirillum sp. CPCC 100848]MEC4722112.1 hypothetical protein [Noviherbaspirillum sp. CPCC 100848]
MDFFVWQGAGAIHSGAMDDERNAARRNKTRSHVMEWLGTGIGSLMQTDSSAGILNVSKWKVDEEKESWNPFKKFQD